MRSGYVAVVGKANAGKSTLINVLAVEFQFPEHLCDAGLDGAFVYHGFMSCCKLYPANVPMQLTKVAIKS